MLFFQCSGCSSLGSFFQKCIGLQRCLHSEAVKVKVCGFLTYKMLALFFVHWTSTALLVTACQEPCLWKDTLAPQRQPVMRSSATCYPRHSAPRCSWVQWCEVWTICLLCHKIALADVMGTDHSFAEIFMAVLSKGHSIQRCHWCSM